jgi:hypothetical protein
MRFVVLPRSRTGRHGLHWLTGLPLVGAQILVGSAGAIVI